MLRVEKFPLIEISGKPIERGRQYGAKAKERVRRSVSHYKKQVNKASLSDAQVSQIIQNYVPLVEKFSADYIAEMHGIAEGAGVSFEDVFLLNARTEVLKLATNRDLQNRFRSIVAADGCTSLTVMPEAAANGVLIQAQNWDWKVECAESCVILKITQPNGLKILTFTEAGMLARNGFNSMGISIVANGLESDRDYSQVGIPLAFIRRKLLEAENVALAMHVVYTTPKSASNNMIVSHQEGISISFECAPDETFMLEPEDGLLIHSNHWLSTIALSKLKDTGIMVSPCSLYRHTRVRRLLSPKVGQITAEHVKAALLDKFESPWSVCRPSRHDTERDMETATVSTVLMQPSLGIMEVAAMPAIDPSFTTYQI